MGIEPTSEAWEASILPLYDARSEAIVPANGLAEKRLSCGREADAEICRASSKRHPNPSRTAALALATQRRSVFLTLRERSFSVKICDFAVTTRDFANAQAERLHWQTQLLR
jgi:hypothetical protein